MASNLLAMASNNLIAMASNLKAMVSNLLAMASDNLLAMASNLEAMASNLIAWPSQLRTPFNYTTPTFSRTKCGGWWCREKNLCATVVMRKA